MLTCATARLQSLIDICVPHQSAFAMDSSGWDPIRVCGMSDPDCTTTCCGKTRANANCKNHISRQSRTDAAHLLQLLALRRPADDSLVETLRKIARLLLCKRNHQHKEDEQVQPLAMRWYESARASRAVGEHGRDSPTESQQIDSPLYPEMDLVDVNSTSLAPMGVEPAAAERHSIRIEQLRQRSVPFEFGTANADNTSTPVILRSLRQDDNGGSIERSVHLGCMGDWLERRSARINFNCPQCRGIARFDASYSAAETTGEADDGVESAGGGRTARGDITSEGAEGAGCKLHAKAYRN
ncbi:hypothetical protein BJX68DRAFT_279739 [Aspergillus pseudodeflectus]|uniref:Uncharacterized protein n=1 Tax=Aspergillus pseudodeflectus TaxID=176178 RepID=A0ABR4JIA6_9EURO